MSTDRPLGRFGDEPVGSGDGADGSGGTTGAADEIVELEEDDRTTLIPESLTISVDLPATVHVAPEEEARLAIADVAVTPVDDIAGRGTTSIDVVAPRVRGTWESSDAAELPRHVPPLPEDDVDSRRDRLRGEVSPSPEPAAMLTADRLLDQRSRRGAPEGFWQRLVYTGTFRRVDLGDSARARARKTLDARIARSLEGGTRFVPILTRKGGVGKTTISTLLGMALADVREDRVIALDANPDRGTLSERVAKQTRSTVRDLVNHAPQITDFGQLSSHVSRDATRLDVLASDTDPLLSEAFDENDYNVVADVVARYYSIVLTDCGTGIVHSVMRATLQRADSVVIVSGGSVDEARLASETLTWLEANEYGHLVRNAVVALNTATQGTNLVKLDEIEAHFRSRVRDVVRIPYDPELAAGSVVRYAQLKPFTRESARQLAALVMDGLPTTRDA